jgi:hypothetical protein
MIDVARKEAHNIMLPESTKKQNLFDFDDACNQIIQIALNRFDTYEFNPSVKGKTAKYSTYITSIARTDVPRILYGANSQVTTTEYGLKNMGKISKVLKKYGLENFSESEEFIVNLLARECSSNKDVWSYEKTLKNYKRYLERIAQTSTDSSLNITFSEGEEQLSLEEIISPQDSAETEYFDNMKKNLSSKVSKELMKLLTPNEKIIIECYLTEEKPSIAKTKAAKLLGIYPAKINSIINQIIRYKLAHVLSLNKIDVDMLK